MAGKYGEPWDSDGGDRPEVEYWVGVFTGRVSSGITSQLMRRRAIVCVNALAGLNPAALADLIAAAEEVWASVPATYDEQHLSVIRHAQALRLLTTALAAMREGSA